MAKPHRSEASSREQKQGSSEPSARPRRARSGQQRSPREQVEVPGVEPTFRQAFSPDPPQRHPWFLMLAALLMALWLLFLLWMAVDAYRGAS
ncbi:MAG TPA: hypothetical protein VHC22_08380 [Pirellulales bacterium]|nr:hypothetical protein [Pirellulales bacterium]